MLTELGLRNFKAFGEDEQKAPMSKITLIYGPNSSGKSSIIQALLLLKQQLRAGSPILMPNGTFTKLGSYTSLLHKHEKDRKLEIRCAFFRRNEPFNRNQPFIADVSMMFVNDQSDNNQGVISEVTYKTSTIGDMFADQVTAERNGESWSINAQKSTVSVGLDQHRKYDVLPRLVSPKSLDEEDTYQLSFQLPPEVSQLISAARELLRTLETLETLENLEEISQQEQAGTIQNNILFTPSQLRAELRAVRYLGPLRSHPERLYDIHTGENTLSLTGADTPVILYQKQEILEKVNHWFKEFEIQLTLEIKSFGDASLTGERFALVMTDVNTNTPVTIADVGFGVNQILPIIVEGVTLSNRRGGILCVEQPEIHIHPRLQAHLADLMIESTRTENDTDIPSQWIVETHSELLILRLQRRIREEKLKPDDVSVLYVSPESGEGATIQRLRLDEEGDFIDQWPDGFFEESFNELMA